MLKRIVLNTNLRDFKTLSFPVSCRRWMSSEEKTPHDASEGEIKLSNILKTKFPNHTEISVQDVSGGCGAFYLIEMEAEEFKGVRTLKRHQMVKEALKDEIKDLHGLKLELKAPS